MAMHGTQGDIRGEKVSIVIPTFNRKDMLIQNIESLRPVWKDIEIIVVDDCSNDGTEMAIVRYIKREKINMKLVINTKNRGVTYSDNRGIGYSSNDIVFVIADDTIILNPEEAIKFLKSHVKEDCIIASRLYNEQEQSWSLLKKARALLYRIPAETLAGEPYNYNSGKARTVKYANGIFAFNRNIGIEFNEKDYKGNFFRTESEFQLKARRKGIKMLYYPQVAVLHRHMKTGGLRSSRDNVLFWSIRNHVVFLKRNFRLSKYYKLPFYFMLKVLAHPNKAGRIISAFGG